jgi:hypothetical protein
VTSFELLGAYRLQVRFEDGVERTIDLEPVLSGAVYGPLRDPAVFRQVKIDPEVHTLVWPNGADFDPATLHDWPEHAEAFAAKAREWQKAKRSA